MEKEQSDDLQKLFDKLEGKKGKPNKKKLPRDKLLMRYFMMLPRKKRIAGNTACLHIVK